jgi:hypothetical protein
LQEETDAAIDASFNILRSRIDHFGVTQPNIQRLPNSHRILVELPGVKEPERVRKLLQGVERSVDRSVGFLLQDLLDLAVRAVRRDILTIRTYEKRSQRSTAATSR